jgi:hypothetical protein
MRARRGALACRVRRGEGFERFAVQGCSSLMGLDASSKRVMSFIVSSLSLEAPTIGAFLAPRMTITTGKALMGCQGR